MPTIKATVPDYGLSSAAIGLGFSGYDRPTRSGIIRAALALFHGQTIDSAKTLAVTDKPSLSAASQHRISAVIPDELDVPKTVNRSYAIRVGLLMAEGWSRAEAEHAAHMERGRPRKDVAA